MTTPNNTVAGLAEKPTAHAALQICYDALMKFAERAFDAPPPWSDLTIAVEAAREALASPAPSATVGCDCGNCEVCDGTEAIAALQHSAAPSVSPSVAGGAGELSWPTDLGWPDKPFTVHDEPGEHDPCWLVMPGGESIALNHHAINGVDQARAHFIADACNARRIATAEQPGSAVQGEAVAYIEYPPGEWMLDREPHIYLLRSGETIPDNGRCRPLIFGDTTPPPAPAADPFQVPKLPGNWPEDANHENGNYECKCWTCGMPFYGHKRRVVCKVCAPTEAPAAEQGEFGPITGDDLDAAREPVPQWSQPEARGVEGEVPLQERMDEYANGTFICPMCGQSGPHTHPPKEVLIYRNGVKYGRSLTGAMPAPAAEQGDDSFVRIENVVRTLPPGYAFADAVEHAAPETIIQPEARGVEGMVPRSDLADLYRAYVRLLEAGRDRIMDLGGTCDPVDMMERSDPFLIRARRALAAAPSGVRVDEMEDLLRSAHEIALRQGADTNWDGLAKSIAKIGIGPITARHYFAEGTPRETINKHLDALLAHVNAALSANEVSRGS